MTDREKILKQLAGIGISLDMDGYHADAQCVRDATNLLREHEPVKPVNVRWEMNIRGGTCPKCLNWVQRSYNYCPFCGKAVKWDD